MSRLEFLLIAAVLRPIGWLLNRMPARPDRVVLATARVDRLDGNLQRIERAVRRLRPGVEVVVLAEPYGYGLRRKLSYAVRLLRGMYHVRTAGLVVVDNAYLPVHVAPHPPRTTIVQVWHAVGALKRFGRDTVLELTEPERTFLHRYYDFVVTTGPGAREPWSRAFGTPMDRILSLGAPRTDFFFDPSSLQAARDRVLQRYPALVGRRVIVYAPTFRGRGRQKRAADGFDVRRLRDTLGDRDVLVLKTHPNLDPALVATDGYDVIVDPASEINDLLVIADVLITDYSSSIFEWALLRKPLVLYVPDLDEYERDPGLYVDLRAEHPGTIVRDTDGLIAALARGGGEAASEAFVARHVGDCDGRASERFVQRFIADDRARAADITSATTDTRQ